MSDNTHVQRRGHDLSHNLVISLRTTSRLSSRTTSRLSYPRHLVHDKKNDRR